jgi:hypothetical protein
MRTYLLMNFFSVVLIVLSVLGNAQNSSLSSWPQWRGPMHTGAAPKGNPPVEFGESKNLKWKREIPGKGHSTPVVWEDKIIVTTAVATHEKASADPAKPQASAGPMPANRTDLVHEFKIFLLNR